MQVSDRVAQWQVPDLSECVSDKMANIAQQVRSVFLKRHEQLREKYCALLGIELQPFSANDRGDPVQFFKFHD